MDLMYVIISKSGNIASTLKSMSTVCMRWCKVSQRVTLANQQGTEDTEQRFSLGRLREKWKQRVVPTGGHSGRCICVALK